MKVFSSLIGVLFQIFLAYVFDFVFKYLQRMSLYAGTKTIGVIGQFMLTIVFVISMMWLIKYLILDNSDNLGLQLSSMVVSIAILLGSLLFHLGLGFIDPTSPLAMVVQISPASYPGIACMIAFTGSLYSFFMGEEVG